VSLTSGAPDGDTAVLQKSSGFSDMPEGAVGAWDHFHLTGL
jgi:hypothetical protein